MDGRRGAGLTLAFGFVLLVLAGRAAPVGQPPLYDGVVVEDPYRYLQPPSGAAGHPTSASDTTDVEGSTSPLIYSGTLENPPQAQLIADEGAFVIPSGTTSVATTIRPIAPPAPVPSGALAGNVYEVRVASEGGIDMAIQQGKTVTVVLRAPNGVTNGTLYRFSGTAWAAVKTVNGGLPDLYATNSTELGDFAVVVTGAASPAPSGGASLGTPTASASPSVPAGGAGGGGSIPWIVIGLVAATVAAGLLWTLFGGSEQTTSGRR
jgi:hypothetical protein